MAIKTRTSRDTYRSNVKKRPLRQNGLEAQYQGLDVTEVNIDHAGLAMIGRGGHQTRRDIRKVRKQYIVDVPVEEHNPTAELIFTLSNGSTPIDREKWGTPTSTPPNLYPNRDNKSLQDLDGEVFSVKDQSGSPAIEFEYSIDASTDVNGDYVYPNGATLANGRTAIWIVGNEYSFKDLLENTKEAIEMKFPEDTFRFEIYQKDSEEMLPGQTEPQVVLEDKIKIILATPVGSSSVVAALGNPLASDYFDVTTNQFSDQRESFEWRLNGFHKDTSNDRIFYEDLRTDTIQSVTPHSIRRSGSFFREAQFPAGSNENNYDANIAAIAGDPTDVSKNRFDTHDSTEVLIRQYPKREEIFDTYRSNFQWREDIHYLAPDQQTWTLMSALATNYHSSLEAHITAMMNSNFADEQYIDPNPMSGRVDVFKRLSRIFDTHVDLIFERHPYSVFDQFLDPIDDFVNLQENKYPKKDDLNSDAAFEDVQGTRQGEKAIWNDYFDQPPLECHDFYEVDRYSKIDRQMQQVIGEEFYSSTLRSSVTWIFSGTFSTTDEGSVYFRSSTMGTLQKRWYEIRFVPSNRWKGTGFTTDPTRDGLTKATAYKATMEYDSASPSAMGLMNTRWLGIWDDPSAYAWYDPSNNISGFVSWGNTSNPNWTVADFNPTGGPYTTVVRATRLDELLDFDSVEIDPILPITFEQVNNRMPTNRSILIDRKEWQDPYHVHTATGFINSQQSGQDGIIYREMMR